MENRSPAPPGRRIHFTDAISAGQLEFFVGAAPSTGLIARERDVTPLLIRVEE